MKNRSLIGIVIICTVLFILFCSIWYSVPSGEELRSMILHDSVSFAPLFTDQHGNKLIPYYTNNDQARFTPIEDVPDHFIRMLIFYEDQSFKSNIGVSITGLLRGIKNYIAGEPGGGSTISQQVMRKISGWKERTVLRKAYEISGAIKLNFSCSKQEILTYYINRVSFGGPRSGIYAASRRYFGKEPNKLSRAESIMLVSFLNLPPKNIARNADKVYEKYRRRVQLAIDANEISMRDPDYDEIIIGPEFKMNRDNKSAELLFLDRVNEELSTLHSMLLLEYGTNIVIQTTLDKKLNDSLCLLLDRELSKLPEDTRGSFVVLDQDNQIVAYVSGLNLRGDFDFIQSKRTLSASRFKTPVAAVAIQGLIQNQMIPQDQIVNLLLPTRYELSEHHIIEDQCPPFITFREAFRESRNAPFYFLCNEIVTPDDIVRFAKYFGLDLLPYPSLPMGVQPVSEMTLAWIYSTILVRDGFIRKPTFIKKISTSDGSILSDANVSNDTEIRVVSSATCKILRQLLRETTFQNGTSSYLASIDSLQDEDISPKTGTTKKFTQLGVTGSINQYTFSLLIQGKKMNQSASKLAVPILSSMLKCMKRNGYF